MAMVFSPHLSMTSSVIVDIDIIEETLSGASLVFAAVSCMVYNGLMHKLSAKVTSIFLFGVSQLLWAFVDFIFAVVTAARWEFEYLTVCHILFDIVPIMWFISQRSRELIQEPIRTPRTYV